MTTDEGTILCRAFVSLESKNGGNVTDFTSRAPVQMSLTLLQPIKTLGVAVENLVG
jgi:hypothetical protein